MEKYGIKSGRSHFASEAMLSHHSLLSNRQSWECLVAQLAAIHSTDDAAAWAHWNLPAKNTLTAADAQLSRSPDYQTPIPIGIGGNVTRHPSARLVRSSYEKMRPSP